MSDLIRLIATAIVWGTLAAIILFSGTASDNIVPLALFLTIGAAISTAAIWDSAKVKQIGEVAQAGKVKRTNHLSHLVDKLDEEEVYQLEDLLASRYDNRMRE